ncbi:MAG: GlsB/YeaQ/YmgE family stress response membrane protein [Minicystis sp.]
MSVIAWIFFGLISGFIASKLVNKQGEGVFLDILLGVVGAVVGGWLFTAFGSTGVSGFNLWSILVAVTGATLTLMAYHLIARRA